MKGTRAKQHDHQSLPSLLLCVLAIGSFAFGSLTGTRLTLRKSTFFYFSAHSLARLRFSFWDRFLTSRQIGSSQLGNNNVRHRRETWLIQLFKSHVKVRSRKSPTLCSNSLLFAVIKSCFCVGWPVTNQNQIAQSCGMNKFVLIWGDIKIAPLWLVLCFLGLSHKKNKILNTDTSRRNSKFSLLWDLTKLCFCACQT